MTDPELHFEGELSAAQVEQLQRQIQYHLSAEPFETVPLNDVIKLRLHISDGVTRPMSSKLLAAWLWSQNDRYRGKTVMDMGTGCGIQAMVCALGGAEEVHAVDVSEAAVDCARLNTVNAAVPNLVAIHHSDLFAEISDRSQFDVIVFAQPYFAGRPLEEYAFTRGMLAPSTLISDFLTKARRFLVEGGNCIMLRWPFAGSGNDPLMAASSCGYKVLETSALSDPLGVQRGSFEAVVLTPV